MWIRRALGSDYGLIASPSPVRRPSTTTIVRRCTVLSIALSVSLQAQVPETRRLSSPTAQLPEEFTNLTSLRELSDGRVLITDRKDARLAVVDFSTGSVKAIGRLGSGPAEYQDLGPVLPLSSDSSVVIDIGNSRWLILVEDRIAATLPAYTPAIQAVLFWVPFGADQLGHVLSTALRRSTWARTDSVDLVLIARATGRSQLVGALRYGLPTQGSPAVSGLPGGRGASVGRPPFNIREEQPLLFPDGWIAVARYEPYRVDWRSPNGEWRQGLPLPVPSVPLTAREREAYIRRSPGARGATKWPVNVPPFDKTFPLVASPDGSLVIPRVPTADQPEPRYDLIDRQGALRAHLVLPVGQRLLALGARSAYVVVTDRDGIERLQRHSWP
jgi:hypothetical protein